MRRRLSLCHAKYLVNAERQSDAECRSIGSPESYTIRISKCNAIGSAVGSAVEKSQSTTNAIVFLASKTYTMSDLLDGGVPLSI